ncbi:hypothetical protein, partial [Haemophilus parainfluenzae]|uniref:hypothetical protein n=1 Tax=Haemophilus parainfluenzae TaxID=729 RepID=UPI001788B7C5
PLDGSTTLEMHPLVREVVLEHLKTVLLAELLEGRLVWLHQIPLVTTTTAEPVQQQQIVALVEPLVTTLRQHYPGPEELIGFFQRIHQALRHQ